MTNIDVKVKDKVLKPVGEVFDAVVNPDKISRFFITRASGPLKAGETVTWFFDDIGGKLDVHVNLVRENELVTFHWSASGVKAQVDIAFAAIDANSTSVLITEKTFPFDSVGV